MLVSCRVPNRCQNICDSYFLFFKCSKLVGDAAGLLLTQLKVGTSANKRKTQNPIGIVGGASAGLPPYSSALDLQNKNASPFGLEKKEAKFEETPTRVACIRIMLKKQSGGMPSRVIHILLLPRPVLTR